MKKLFAMFVIGMLLLITTPAQSRDGTTPLPDTYSIASAGDFQNSFIDLVVVNPDFILPFSGIVYLMNYKAPALLIGEMDDVFVPPVISNLSGINSKQLKKSKSTGSFSLWDYG